MTDKAKLEKIKKLADAMYYAAFNLTTDASLLRKAIDDYHQFIINEYHKEEPLSESIDFEQELYKAFGQIKDFTLGVAIAKRFYDMGRKHNEPVSEELEEAAKQYLENSNPDRVHQITNAFKAGAKWNKEYMMKEIKSRLVDAATNQDNSANVAGQTYYNGMVDALGRLRDKFMED